MKWSKDEFNQSGTWCIHIVESADHYKLQRTNFFWALKQTCSNQQNQQNGPLLKTRPDDIVPHMWKTPACTHLPWTTILIA